MKKEKYNINVEVRVRASAGLAVRAESAVSVSFRQVCSFLMRFGLYVTENVNITLVVDAEVAAQSKRTAQQNLLLMMIFAAVNCDIKGNEQLLSPSSANLYSAHGRKLRLHQHDLWYFKLIMMITCETSELDSFLLFEICQSVQPVSLLGPTEASPPRCVLICTAKKKEERKGPPLNLLRAVRLLLPKLQESTCGPS